MSLTLGIYPEQSVRNQMHNIATDVVRVVESQGVPVTFVDPNSYHIELFSLGVNRTSPLYWFYHLMLSKTQIPVFDIDISSVRLGLGGKLREIIYLQVDEGSDQLRDAVYSLSKTLRIKRAKTFNPSVRIARIGKEVSEQESHNLVNSINEINNSSPFTVRFQFSGLSVVGFKEGTLHEFKKFSM